MLNLNTGSEEISTSTLRLQYLAAHFDLAEHHARLIGDLAFGGFA